MTGKMKKRHGKPDPAILADIVKRIVRAALNDAKAAIDTTEARTTPARYGCFKAPLPLGW